MSALACPPASGGGPVHLPALSFDSDHFASNEDAFWAWRDSVTALFDVAVPSAAALSTFQARMQTYHMGSMLLGSIASVAQHFRRSAATIARGGVNHYLVQGFREGGYRGDANGKPMQVDAGDIGLLDMSQPMHALSEGFRYTALVIPRPLLEPLLNRPDAVHGAVIRGNTAPGRILSEHLTSIYERAGQLSVEQAQLILQATSVMIAGCVGPIRHAAENPAADMRIASLANIKGYLEANLGSPDLRPDAICQRFGLSRPTLFRLFEPYGGFIHYLRERRLRRCFSDITSPFQAHRRISDIADTWGFHNEAVFSRAFRRMYEASPREIRQAAFSARHDGGSVARGKPGQVADMDAWVRGLGGF